MSVGWQSKYFNSRVAQDTQYSNTAIKAAVSGFTLYVTDIDICCGGTGTNFTILDGSGGTVLFKCALAANTSCIAHLQVPIKFTASTGIFASSGAASTGAFVGVNGFIHNI